jgi:hypothetical protein
LPQRRGVERARLNPVRLKPCEPLAQLTRRPRRECDGQHMPRLDLPSHHAVGDAVGDGAGLARPRSGQDAHRPGSGDHGRLLLLVEAPQD